MQKVRLLGICGSPRKTGNSRYLLECAVAGAKAAAPESVQSEIYSFAGKKIGPCVSCYRCAKIGDCATRDDFQELRDKWVAADAIIYSVPVYHIGIPGQLKCFIDRLGRTLYIRYGDLAHKNLKTVGIVVQGGDIFAGQEQVMYTLINHALLMKCVPVGADTSPYLGAAGWTRDDSGKDSLRRLHDEGEPDAQIAVAAAESLGKRIAQMTLLTKSGGLVCREMLVKDGTYGPFLSRLAPGEEVG